MANPPGLPPGVSQALFNALPAHTLFYDGLGQTGVWADPANWWAGVPGGPNSTVLIPVNATLNGNVAVRQMMMLGSESVTVSGALTTNSIGPCNSFMVCDDAVVNFAAGSALDDMGGLIVGNEDVGTLNATGASLNTVATKIGRFADGTGSVSLNGGHWTNSASFFVGMSGIGTLSMSANAQLSVGTSFVVGRYAGAQGHVSLAGGAALSVGGDAKIGGGDPGINGGSGTGTLSVGIGSSFTIAGLLGVFAQSTLSMAGGTVVLADARDGLNIHSGGTLSGFGTVTAGGIIDNGTISAVGGTLALNGTLSGGGALQIGATSTLKLSSSMLGKNLGLAFIGEGGMLGLAHGVVDAATISGFGVGDSILMSGVDHLAFNTTNDKLTLSDGGHVVDTLKFTGAFTGDTFTLAQSGGSAMIGLASSHV